MPRRAAPLAWFLVFAIGCLAVLFDRTWRFGEVFSPADAIFTSYPWAYDTARPIPQNLTRTDEAYYHQPMAITHWARLRAGDFPEWDPHVLGGVPSFQQELSIGQAFSPLSLPFYLFDPGTAVTVYAPLRLLVAALLMWAYLRHRGASAIGAATGGIAFGLNGAFIVWLSAPMPTVALWLPLVLLAIDRTVDRGHPRDAALLAIATAASLLGAYAPTSIVVCATAGAYALASLAARRGTQARVTVVTRLAAAAAGGAGLAAVGIVPMLATLAGSPARGRSVAASTLPASNVATFALPDFWGSPLVPNWWYDGSGNYPEFVTYLGVTTLALAAAGLVASFRRRDVRSLALAAVGLLALLAMYGLPPATWLGMLPGFRQMNPYRWNVALACATAVLAGLGVDALRRTGGEPGGEPRDERAAPAVPWGPWLASWALLALLGLSASIVLWSHLDDIRRLSLQAFEKRQVVRFASLACATALVALLVAWTSGRRARAGRAAALAVCALVALDLLVFAHGFNATLPRERMYPSTPGIDALTRIAAGGRVAPVAPAGQFVDGHVWQLFGLEVVTGFDYFGDTTYQAFVDRASRPASRGARWDYVGIEEAARVDLRLLGLLNVTAVATPPQADATRGAGYETLGELTSGRRVSQVFHCSVSGLRGIDVLSATYDRTPRGAVTLSLVRVSTGATVATRHVPAGEVPNNGWLRLAFAPIADSVGEWRLDVDAQDAVQGKAVTLWTTTGPATSPGRLEIDGAPDPRSLWFRTFAAAPSRVPGATLVHAGDLDVYTNPHARPRAWFVGEVDVLPRAAHLDLLATPSYDLAVRAVLDAAPAERPTSTARVLSYSSPSPDSRLIHVEAPQGGVLVVSERSHAGWRARVDGVPVAVIGADAVLLAVAVPPGSAEVALDYRHPARLPSLAITLVAGLGIGLALARAVRAPRSMTSAAARERGRDENWH